MHIKQSLALLILKFHFGDIVHQCARAILAKGMINLRDYINDCKEMEKLSEQQARDSLGCLLHHRAVTFVPPQDKDSLEVNPTSLITIKSVIIPYKKLMYYLELDNIIFRLRFPSIVDFARVTYSQNEASILQLFCLHGRLTFDQIEKVVQSKGNITADQFPKYF